MKWKIGNLSSTVVSDEVVINTNFPSPPSPPFSPAEDVEYYGGYLVCESIGNSNHASLIAAAPDLFEAVEKAQTILAKWIVPDSKISDKTALEALVGVLDDVQLVSKMRIVKPLEQEKSWPTSGNVEKTSYNKDAQELEILFRNGKSYRYKEVPLEVWVKLKEASSIGSFLHSEIKGRYGYYEIK